jgi:hypothetical protein
MEEAVLAVGVEVEAITEVVVLTDINHIMTIGGVMIAEDLTVGLIVADTTVGLIVDRLIELIVEQDSRLSVDYVTRFTTGRISVPEMIKNNSKCNQDSRRI